MQGKFEVCIFGVGPAGTAVALRLTSAGLSVAVLDRPSMKRWGGESLSGAIQQPLRELGLWDRFCAAGHVAGYEQRTTWGGEPWCKSSIFAGHGNLWHVDRNRFDRDLREAALQSRISVNDYCDLENLQFEDGEWNIQIDGGNRISAKYLVDASGRNRVVARRLGVLARTYDRLIGFTALVARNPNSDLAHAMMLESTPQGWWYAAPVPQGHVLAFFTDSDLAPHHLPRSMKTVAANSSFAPSLEHKRWLTVGDACAAHDPLCGWGVYRALSNGILAGDAILRYLKTGDGSLLEEYSQRCRSQFDSYLQGLSRHYSYEKRWLGHPFWERRTKLMNQSA